MRKPSLLDDYLDRYAASPLWNLNARSRDDIRQVVVIPAYAEIENLFFTLASLSQNPPDLLKETLILCVINAKAQSPEAVKENNAKTLCMLKALMDGRRANAEAILPSLSAVLSGIARSPVRLGYIDAASPGREIPDSEGGVGMARKIGMDMALRILKKGEKAPGVILSLDADTLVRPDYLACVRNFFSDGRLKTGIVNYAHQLPDNDEAKSAICAYEIFLRYYVLGLNYAASPYAFSSIGSTMTTTAEAYLAVRGMNRRAAGEDFYFLNKLAKIGPVLPIDQTVVYPSARTSGRVPFGTGAAMQKMSHSSLNEFPVYAPEVFDILKQWLSLANQSCDLPAEEILAKSRQIHPGLETFLMSRRFPSVWTKISNNMKQPKGRQRQFSIWFDGFETLKLINFMSRHHYQKVPLAQAVARILSTLAMSDGECPPAQCLNGREDKFRVLQFLRKIT